MSAIVITEATWSRIRERFSEEEKQQLRDAHEGGIICPKGEIIEGDRLGAELRAKVKRLNIREKGDAKR